MDVTVFVVPLKDGSITVQDHNLGPVGKFIGDLIFISNSEGLKIEPLRIMGIFGRSFPRFGETHTVIKAVPDT